MTLVMLRFLLCTLVLSTSTSTLGAECEEEGKLLHISVQLGQNVDASLEKVRVRVRAFDNSNDRNDLAQLKPLNRSAAQLEALDVSADKEHALLLLRQVGLLLHTVDLAPRVWASKLSDDASNITGTFKTTSYSLQSLLSHFRARNDRDMREMVKQVALVRGDFKAYLKSLSEVQLTRLMWRVLKYSGVVTRLMIVRFSALLDLCKAAA